MKCDLYRLKRHANHWTFNVLISLLLWDGLEIQWSTEKSHGSPSFFFITHSPIKKGPIILTGSTNRSPQGKALFGSSLRVGLFHCGWYSCVIISKSKTCHIALGNVMVNYTKWCLESITGQEYSEKMALLVTEHVNYICI